MLVVVVVVLLPAPMWDGTCSCMSISILCLPLSLSCDDVSAVPPLSLSILEIDVPFTPLEVSTRRLSKEGCAVESAATDGWRKGRCLSHSRRSQLAALCLLVQKV